MLNTSPCVNPTVSPEEQASFGGPKEEQRQALQQTTKQIDPSPFTCPVYIRAPKELASLEALEKVGMRFLARPQDLSNQEKTRRDAPFSIMFKGNEVAIDLRYDPSKGMNAMPREVGFELPRGALSWDEGKIVVKYAPEKDGTYLHQEISIGSFKAKGFDAALSVNEMRKVTDTTYETKISHEPYLPKNFATLDSEEKKIAEGIAIAALKAAGMGLEIGFRHNGITARGITPPDIIIKPGWEYSKQEGKRILYVIDHQEVSYRKIGEQSWRALSWDYKFYGQFHLRARPAKEIGTDIEKMLDGIE